MSTACIICHKRKVKCDLAINLPCTNCKKADSECRPYTRKRKRFTNSLSPSRETSPAQKPQGERQQQDPDSHQTQEASSSSIDRAVSVSSRSPCSARQKDAGRPAVLAPSQADEESYCGRSEYLGGSVPFNEAMVKPGPAATGHHRSLQKSSDADLEMLMQQRAFELPPQPTLNRVVDCFMRFCAPWNPIIDPGWREEQPAPSELLLQAVLLAGSKVSSGYMDNAASAAFYRRAKLLFFFGGGNMPLSSITAACLLHWYNPVGPENVSSDTSGFWIRVAGAMAFQIGLHKEPSPQRKDRGLRRRLWWTLVTRDSIISAGVGRPRTINLHDSNVLPPSLDDFPEKDDKARVFLAYVTICRLLGDTVEACLRKELSLNRRVELENDLFRWMKQAMRGLQPSSVPDINPASNGLEVRQLLVVYFVVLNILHRSPAPNSEPSATSLVASSFIAGIYEQFFKRDELEYLGPAFTFYGLCAGLSLLSAIRYPALQKIAEYEFTIIKLSLQQLSKRWHSAVGILRALDQLTVDSHQQSKFDAQPPTLDLDMAGFFEDFDKPLCKQWDIIMQPSQLPPPAGGQPSTPERSTASILADFAREEEHDRDPDIGSQDLQQHREPHGQVDNFPALDLSAPGDPSLMNGDWEGLGFDWSGAWLLNL